MAIDASAATEILASRKRRPPALEGVLQLRYAGVFPRLRSVRMRVGSSPFICSRYRTFILPAPSAIALSLYRGLASGVFVYNFLVTAFQTLVGFVIAAVIGTAIGAAVAQFSIVERVVYPWLVALQTLPKIALAPLIIIWAGYGISSKIIIVALAAIFPVLVNTIMGLKSCDQGKLDLMRSLGAGRWETFRTVRLPNALPFIFAGLNVAIVLAILGSIVGEFVGSKAGLGNLDPGSELPVRRGAHLRSAGDPRRLWRLPQAISCAWRSDISCSGTRH